MLSIIHIICNMLSIMSIDTNIELHAYSGGEGDYRLGIGRNLAPKYI